MSSPESTPNGKRRQRLIALSAVVLFAGIVYGAYWLLYARFYESTDNAYVASDLIQITSEVAGTVRAVYVDDTQHVERGQLLVELDRTDAEIAMERAEAGLARSVREVRGLFAQAAALRAQLRQREVLLATARADLERRQSIADGGAVSLEELQHAKDQVAQLEAELNATRQELQSVQARIDGTTIETHPQVLLAAARVRDAALALARTRIVAPVSGTIARRGVQIGARIAAGTPLMALVPLENVWVDANFKEVQLAHVRIGQPVRLTSDFYGDGVVYHGRVAGISAGSGAVFSLLPPQNASGNWIKIVQRVPVRIELDPEELKKHPLRVGLSMRARIDLHDTSGPLLATQVRARPQERDADATVIEAATQRIANIIAVNAGKTIAGQL